MILFPTVVTGPTIFIIPFAILLLITVAPESREITVPPLSFITAPFSPHIPIPELLNVMLLPLPKVNSPLLSTYAPTLPEPLRIIFPELRFTFDPLFT